MSAEVSAGETAAQSGVDIEVAKKHEVTHGSADADGKPEERVGQMDDVRLDMSSLNEEGHGTNTAPTNGPGPVQKQPQKVRFAEGQPRHTATKRSLVSLCFEITDSFTKANDESSIKTLNEQITNANVLLEHFVELGVGERCLAAIHQMQEGLVYLRLPISDTPDKHKLAQALVEFRTAYRAMEEVFTEPSIPRRQRLHLVSTMIGCFILKTMACDVPEIPFTMVGEKLRVISAQREVNTAAMRAIRRLDPEARAKKKKKQKENVKNPLRVTKIEIICGSLVEQMLNRLGSYGAWEVWNDTLVTTGDRISGMHYLIDLMLNKLAPKDRYINYEPDTVRVGQRKL